MQWGSWGQGHKDTEGLRDHPGVQQTQERKRNKSLMLRRGTGWGEMEGGGQAFKDRMKEMRSSRVVRLEKLH